MSSDTEDRSSKQLSLPLAIAPLQRATEMSSNDQDDEHPSKHHKNGFSHHHDMYPGFGRIASHHRINSNPQTREDGCTVQGHGNLLQLDRNSHAVQDYNTDQCTDNDTSAKKPSKENSTKEVQPTHEMPALSQKPLANRKRRRKSTPEDEPSPTKQSEKKPHKQKSYVHHEYHDYSGLSGGPVVLPPLAPKGRGGVSSMFPTVLHHMLDDAERLNFAHIVSWQPHGRAFHVHKPEEFVSRVMTKYFRHTRLSSFQRQLSLYGFTRLARKGPDRGAYYHECFLRGLTHLCSNMQRTRVKGTMVRQSSSPETEPDFSTLPPVGVGHKSISTTAAASLGQPTEATLPVAASNTRDLHQSINDMPPLDFDTTADLPGIPEPLDLPFALLGTQSQSDHESPQQQQHTSNSHADQSEHEQQQDPSNSLDATVVPARAWGTKYMRHLLTRGKHDGEYSQQREEEEKRSPARQLSKSPAASQSSSSGDSKQAAPPKVEADLAVFLEEVDLDTDDDECLESEEAMARILEQDISRISEV